VVVPWAEELYFRGYLLPRMGALGRWAPLVNTALFSLYHVWLPWEFFSRVVALLPAIYVVWWKRDLRVSIWVHMLLNSTGSIGLLGAGGQRSEMTAKGACDDRCSKRKDEWSHRRANQNPDCRPNH